MNGIEVSGSQPGDFVEFSLRFEFGSLGRLMAVAEFEGGEDLEQQNCEFEITKEKAIELIEFLQSNLGRI